MKNNFIRIFITARSKQDWQRICNLVALVNEVKVVHRYEETTGTLASVRKFMPDVLIIDIDLPQGQGVALLRQVHQDNPSLAVIVLSYYSSPQYRKLCEHAGAAFFFDKSTEFQQIALILQKLINRRVSKFYISNYC